MTKKPPLIIEVPDGQVKRKATFYPMMGGVLDGLLSYRTVSKQDFFPPFHDALWNPKNEERFAPIDVPLEMQKCWSHKLLTFDVSEITPLLSDLRMNDDELIPHLPDIGPWFPFSIVSERAKYAIQEIASEASYFLPVKIYSQSDELIEKPFFWWIARHRLIYRNDTIERPVLSVPFPGPFSDSGMVYEMTNIPSIHSYLKDLPFWGKGNKYTSICFGREAFEKLKSQRLTGLVENTEERYAADRKLFESIGHIA